MDDFLNNKEHKSIYLFAHHNREQELNPQGTEQFTRTLAKYCDNTSAFLRYAASNQALTTTHIIHCYTYNVSLQIYRTQIRIIKNIKELHQTNTNNEHAQQMGYLFKALNQLDDFARAYCIPLKKQSPCANLLNMVHNAIQQPDKSTKWIKHLDAKDALIYMIDTLPEHIQFIAKPSKRIVGFFNMQSKTQSDAEQTMEYANESEEMTNSP